MTLLKGGKKAVATASEKDNPAKELTIRSKILSVEDRGKEKPKLIISTDVGFADYPTGLLLQEGDEDKFKELSFGEWTNHLKQGGTIDNGLAKDDNGSPYYPTLDMQLKAHGINDNMGDIYLAKGETYIETSGERTSEVKPSPTLARLNSCANRTAKAVALRAADKARTPSVGFADTYSISEQSNALFENPAHFPSGPKFIDFATFPRLRTEARGLHNPCQNRDEIASLSSVPLHHFAFQRTTDGLSSRRSGASGNNSQPANHIDDPYHANSALAHGPSDGNRVNATKDMVVQHLQSQFNVDTFSDCFLELHLPNHETGLFLHSVLLHGSKLLASMAHRTHETRFDECGRVVIKMQTNLGGLSVKSIDDALRTLYGVDPEEILQVALTTPLDPVRGERSLTNRMALVVKFFIAGVYLQIASVVDTALKAFREEITFDNLEFTIAFALRGTEFSSDHNIHDQEYVRKSLHGTFLELGISVYGARTQEILSGCLEYLVENFPRPLSFDTQAPISYALGAFTIPSDGPPSVVHPKLHGLESLTDETLGGRFKINRVHTRISTILLSVPFNVLAHVHQRLVAKRYFFNMDQVVQARNLRSLICIRSVAWARNIVARQEITMRNMPQELFVEGVLVDRAKWLEQCVVNDSGIQEVSRSYLGPAA